MAIAYEALARSLDERNHGVRGDAVRAGLVGAQGLSSASCALSLSVLALFVFGAFGEASVSLRA